MEVLPPTIPDQATLELLGRCLAVEADAEEDSALRLAFFAPGFSWNRLISLAVEQNVIVPLVHCLKARGLLLPPPRRPSTEAGARHPTPELEAIYERHLERQDDLRAQLFAIVAALNGQAIVPLALKGARFLLPDAPSWAAARTMRDIDLLVHRDEASRAHEAIAALGYESLPSLSMTDHHLAPMRKDGHYGSIELHTKALVQDARTVLATDDIRSLSEEKRFGETRLHVMPPGWQMLMGVLHHQIGDRGYRRRVLALKGLWEFANEARDLSEGEWQTVVRLTEDRGGHGALMEWLALAERLLGLTPPAGAVPQERDRRRAAATLRWARQPAGLRRTLFITDVLLFAFSRKRLAMRYDCEPRGLMLGVRLKHLMFLLARHGRLQAQRMFPRRS